MVVNKHGSFYLRSGWGTKIIQAVNEDELIFSPANEVEAVDNIGLGRVMVRSLRYWAYAMELTEEKKVQTGVKHEKTVLFKLIDEFDHYFQKSGSLLLLHRNLARSKDNATAWYWGFNEFGAYTFDKNTFVDGFLSYLAVNGIAIKNSLVEKEFNCFKNTYIGEKKFNKTMAMDEDTYPFFGPLHLLKMNDEKKIEKVLLTKIDVPIFILIYAIAMDNLNESRNGMQVRIDKLMEEPLQIGKYFNIRYADLLDMLLVAQNKKLLVLNNNFGNRFIEFVDVDYSHLLDRYYTEEDVEQ